MDSSITRRDAAAEARIASSAYAQAHAVLQANPAISAADLVERLRERAEALADDAGEDDRVVPEPGAATPREAGRPGLGAAAAAARERAPGAPGAPS